MALLSGHGKPFNSALAGKWGLDEISGSNSTGTNTTGAAVAWGKRLSQDFYKADETSLSGMGSLLIFDDLTQRLKLRAQAEERSSLDLISHIRRD